MTDQKSSFPIRLFYSYCHKDDTHRESMETSLGLLKKNNLLESWSDRNILPGQNISERVKKEMDKSNVIVFLFSQNFIASSECMQEWEYAKKLVKKNGLVSRIPIILTKCAWKDMIADDGIKALPTDGKPVVEYSDSNDAWHDVYEGIKTVISDLRNSFLPKKSFLEEIAETEFLSQQHIKLQDIFVFPTLTHDITHTQNDSGAVEEIIDQDRILKNKYTLIHGDELSGKTALGRYLFLNLVNASKPVLYINLKQISGKPAEKIFIDKYAQQFEGDYFSWKEQNQKTLILDNLSPNNNLDFILFAKNYFDRIIVTVSTDIFNSFFRDEKRLADFFDVRIETLTHKQQETLIKKRLSLSDTEQSLMDGRIDQVEKQIDSITIHRIIPRHPFYILSILQTQEVYMPRDVSITSYGHCYYALILATLIKAEISHTDKEINVCFNFLERLAFSIYQNKEENSVQEFKSFIENYRDEYIISEIILNRLQHAEFGIINMDGKFRTSFMYYFFLGRFLSKNGKTYGEIIEKMCESTYVTSNYLTLLFIIHHADDMQVIDEILLGTMRALENTQPALLSQDETKIFDNVLNSIKGNILSSDSVEREREKERENRDDMERQTESENEEENYVEDNLVNDLYRILKNNEILGQILKNKYGNLEKSKIEEIIEVVADGGLRSIKTILQSEKEMTEYALYIHKKYPKENIANIKKILQHLSFVWTMVNVEKIVFSLYHPEIKKVLNKVVEEKSTPAYDLIGYFSKLDGAEELTPEIRNTLKELLRKHDHHFIKKVLSLRTQYYMNTHHGKSTIEQSICSLLKINYSQKNMLRKK